MFPDILDDPDIPQRVELVELRNYVLNQLSIIIMSSGPLQYQIFYECTSHSAFWPLLKL